MRIDKLLAHCGHGTRKEVKGLLKTKVVTVNDEIITSAKHNITPETDVIYVDDELCIFKEHYYLLMNKPQGVVSAREDFHDETVLDLIDFKYFTSGVFPVGRLDKDTTGLLLLTNDGQLSHKLLSPKAKIDKTYHVTLAKPLTMEMAEQLENQVTLEDGYVCLPAKVTRTDNDLIILLTIHEGKFHQVKRMLLAVDNEVVSLKRQSMGPLTLNEQELPLGTFRELTDAELEQLTQATK